MEAFHVASHAEIRAEWRKRIAEYRAGGMTQKDIARKYGCSAKSVSRWNQRFDARLHLLPTYPPSSPSNRSTGPPAPQRLAVVQTDERPGDAACRPPDADVAAIRMSIGCVGIEVRPGFDETLLADVIRVVKSSCYSTPLWSECTSPAA